MYPTVPKEFAEPQMPPSTTEVHHHHTSTGIPMALVTALPLGSQQLNPWTTGLCDCCEDCSNSCATTGALYALINCFLGFGCLYSCFYRSTKIGAQHSPVSRPCPDWAVHFFCESCALCQEYRELQNRGFDLSIGWHGNLEKWSRAGGAAVVPPGVGEGMGR